MIPLRDSIRARSVCVVNYLLILINIAVFIYQMSLASYGALEPFILQYSVVPVLLIQDPAAHVMGMVTSQFLHGGLMHLLGNMVYLYIFGDNVEDKLGHGGYLFFYILSGIGASLLQVYLNPQSSIPMLGASGAIAGVLGAYFIMYPKATVETLIPLGFFSRIVEIPAFLFLGLWFFIQAYSGAATAVVTKSIGQDVGGVAWWAHVGGFIVGILGGVFSRLRLI